MSRQAAPKSKPKPKSKSSSWASAGSTIPATSIPFPKDYNEAIGHLSEDEQSEIDAHEKFFLKYPLGYAVMLGTTHVGPILIYSQSDKEIPLESITFLAMLAQHPRLGGSFLNMNFITHGLRALLKLLGIEDKTVALESLSDDFEEPSALTKERQMGIGGLLHCFSGMVSNSSEARKKLLEEQPNFLPWIVKFLRKTKTNLFKPHLYNILAEFAPMPNGLVQLKRLDAHKLMYEAITEHSTTYWTTSFVTSNICKKQINTTEMVASAMVYLLCDSSTRGDLLNLGIEDKVLKMMKVIQPKKQIKVWTYLQSIYSAIKNENYVAVLRRAEQESFPILSRCAYCQKTNEPGAPSFKKCGNCRAVQYCGRECQLADWKKDHKEMCPMLGKLKNISDIDKNVDFDNLTPETLMSMLMQYNLDFDE
eukprot:TRINITY_DN9509_c0_g1_i1.p1 TRINITY_DN9509_c0_g1~~TRINITY_DN9509_c0_g1_i1.p1  ORF type:complete len:421 (-),score=79.43 TRINITY_DN9509_c0_g1_i1:42-1304(-)